MTSFARLNEAFKHNNEFTKRASSNSSSSSIRLKSGGRRSGHSSCSSDSPGPVGGGTTRIPDFNNDYRVKHPSGDTTRTCTQDQYFGQYANDHDYFDNRYSGGESDTQINDYCLGLINQVLQNGWCKKILRNILLEEYMDGLIKQKIDTFGSGCHRSSVNYKYAHQSQTDSPMSRLDAVTTDEQTGGGPVDFLPSGSIFGLDLRTLSIIGLGILVALYVYDLFNRLFR